MHLVSEPRGLLLVRDPTEDNHETTLVVPDLPAAKVVYFRCLVDEGARFVEHAVVMPFLNAASGVPIGARAIVGRALSAARPTTVTFLGGELDESPSALGPGEAAPTPAGVVAAAVCHRAAQGPLNGGEAHPVPLLVEGRNHVLRVSRQGLYYLVE